MFFCEYCEILKSTYFEEHLWTTTFLYGAVTHDFLLDPMNINLRFL